MKRRDFIKQVGMGTLGAFGIMAAGCQLGAAENGSGSSFAQAETVQETSKEKIAGTDGEIYTPYEQRTGNESVVYFTRDLSAAGLMKAYAGIRTMSWATV